jgi:hypothetical protein
MRHFAVPAVLALTALVMACGHMEAFAGATTLRADAAGTKHYRLNTNPGGEGAHRANPPAATNDPTTATSDYPYNTGVTAPIPVPRGAIVNGKRLPSVPRASATR